MSAFRSVPRFCPVLARHGHMVNVPKGANWSPSATFGAKKHKKWHKKGTYRMQLHNVEPNQQLLYRQEDRKMILYAYQLETVPRTKTCDPLEHLCNLTKTAEPVDLEQGKIPDPDIVHTLAARLTQHCHGINQTFHLKGLSPNPSTPLELERFAEYYTKSFLQQLVSLLTVDARTALRDRLHCNRSVNTGTFWRVNVVENTKRCHNFQLYNTADLLLRSDSRLYHSYLESGMERNISGVSLPNTCTQNLHVFRETRDVVQYPGFNKNTFYPYNHTIMKVVSPTLTDRDMQATAMMSGFCQVLPSLQYREDFLVHVDKLPAVREPEAVNVVVTDGDRYALAVYQCNTTNMCGLKEDEGRGNGLALAPVQSIFEGGTVNHELLQKLVGMLIS